MAKQAFVIFADGEVDQVVETAADCRRECRDLRELGFKVDFIQCDWEHQDRVIENFS